MLDFLAILDEWIAEYGISPTRLRLKRCREEICALREQVARLQRQIFKPEEE